MDITLQVSTQAGETVIRLFKDAQSPNSYKEFACVVTVREHDYRSDIPASDLQDLLQAIRSAKISAVGSCGLGIDGTSYKLTIEDGTAYATYRWWMNPDRGWCDLEEIAGMLIRLGSKVSGQYLP